MTAEQSKNSLKLWPIAAIALVLIVLAMKVSFISVNMFDGLNSSDAVRRTFVVWNDKNIDRNFRTFDSTRESCRRSEGKMKKVLDGLTDSHIKHEAVLFEACHEGRVRDVENAPYLFSF